jgi:hypothetical protein
MTAAQYVNQYHTISVPVYRVKSDVVTLNGVVSTPVDEYLNKRYTNRAGYSHDQRWKFRAGVWDFLDTHAGLENTPVYYLGAGVTIQNSHSPLAYVDKGMFNSAFVGKADPPMLQSVIHALSYWRAWREQEQAAGLPSLISLVDMFLGSDCNGFVGNYMQTKYKSNDFRCGPSTPEEDFFYNRKEIRDDPMDLRADDVILLNRTPNKDNGEVAVDWDKKSKKEMEAELSLKRPLVGHIMVISSVGGVSGNQAEVMVSESATSAVVNGGPRTLPWTLRRTGTYRWKMVGRDREVHSIIKVKRTG